MSKAEIEAFVIGPIGDKDAEAGTPARIAYEQAIEVLEEVIAPACEFCGVSPVRADQIARTGEINDQIFRRLKEAHIVIADLSGANPNVMYELGLRHSTGKLTIQIGERERLPFDVSAIRTIRFKRTPGGLIEARRLLGQAITTALQSGGDPVTATRIWFEDTSSNLELVAEDQDEAGEPGFLELQAQSEQSMTELSQVVTVLGSIMDEISLIFQAGTKQAKLIESKAGYAVDRLALADQIANELGNPIVRFEITTADYERHLQRIQPGIQWLLDRLEANPEELQEAPEFLGQMRGFLDAVRSSIDGAQQFHSTAGGMSDMTRKMRKAMSQIQGSIDKFSSQSQQILRWDQQLDRIEKRAKGEPT